MDNINKNYNTEDLINNFQEQVKSSLIRHKSILDVMTKLDEFNARINRAVAKSVTTCGCISIHAEKQNFDGDDFGSLSDKVNSHLHGELCGSCQDVLEEEIGNYIFYLVAMCDTLGLNLKDIISKEFERNKLLGVYSLK